MSPDRQAWLDYLTSLEGGEHDAALRRFRAIDANVTSRFGRPIAPAITTPGDDGGMSFVWQTPGEVFELEVFPSHVEWFHRDRDRNLCGGDERVLSAFAFDHIKRLALETP